MRPLHASGVEQIEQPLDPLNFVQNLHAVLGSDRSLDGPKRLEIAL
jgi:hypothetical protein